MMSIRDRLEDLRARTAANKDPAAAKVIEDAIVDVRRRGVGSTYPANGRMFPDFRLPIAGGGTFSLAEARARGPVVIAFYRGIWCPYCNIELEALEDIHADLKAEGASLLAISPQQAASSRKAGRALTFPILVDEGNRFAERIGIRHEVSSELRALYEKLGVNLGVINAGGTWSLPMPSRFVVGTDGVVVSAETDADYRMRPEPRATLDLVRRLAGVRA